MSRISVLDHGYIELIETWGSEERIIEAARMSTGKGFSGWSAGDPCERCKGTGMFTIDWREGTTERCKSCYGSGKKLGDERLLRYLWENKHHTPFEMAGATLEIQAPIFVFREWHRHRTQSYNELSARYTPLPDMGYVPSIERLMIGNDGKNRQAGTLAGVAALSESEALLFQSAIREHYARAEMGYQAALRAGVPKELARIHLPVGRYSRMRASANLRNWLGFMALRSSVKSQAAQWEIRQYADAGLSMLDGAFPRTVALFRGTQ